MTRWMIACAVAGLGIYLLVEVNRADSRSTPGAEVRAAVPAPVARPVMTRHEYPRPAIERATRGPVEPKGDDDDRAMPEPPRTGEEMREHIQAVFAADVPVAPNQIAPGLEQRLHAAIHSGTVVRGVECRGSLCRVETIHASVDEFRDFVRRAYVTLDSVTRVSNGPVFAELLAPAVEGQPVVAVAFLGREGTVLPMAMPVGSAGVTDP